MDNLLTSAVVAALVSGVVSLAVPWAQWRVERKKLRVHHQREAVREWREGIEAWEQANGGGASVPPPSFIKERWYFSVRPHLTDAERAIFETVPSTPTIVLSPPGQQGVWSHFTKPMLDAIDRIEKEWELP